VSKANHSANPPVDFVRRWLGPSLVRLQLQCLIQQLLAVLGVQEALLALLAHAIWQLLLLLLLKLQPSQEALLLLVWLLLVRLLVGLLLGGIKLCCVLCRSHSQSRSAVLGGEVLLGWGWLVTSHQHCMTQP
jgi:hypothetical protein